MLIANRVSFSTRTKTLFYCYGCGRGGDVIRFAELYHGVPFGDAIALLRRWSGADSLLNDVIKFYPGSKPTALSGLAGYWRPGVGNRPMR